MSCEGLKGNKREKCIKDYVSKAKKIYKNFDIQKDTLITYSNNSQVGAIDMLNNDPRINKSLGTSLTKSTDKKDNYPYKINVVTRKQNGSK